MSLRKCACIDTLYTELPWKERFQAAKEDGFAAVEFWDWRDKDLKDTKEAAESAEILISGFNGDADYSLVDPEHREKYLEELKKSIEAAKKVGAFSLTIHSNALGEGGVVVKHYEELSDTVKICCMYDGLLACARLAEQENINLNLEALNISVDHVGNFLSTTRMGHIHVADVPGCHEPGTGEIQYKKVLRHLESCGYKGLVGYELFPLTDTKSAVQAIMEEC